jgi:uncharacterized cupin superfamily protein
MPNIFEPHFDEQRDAEGFTRERAWIGRQAGAQRLGASIWVIEPGDAAYPYHFHYGDEEMIVVLDGAPSLRTPEGWSELSRGEVVAFPAGEASAHQLVNRTDEPVRFLALSTVDDVDAVVYPDSDKVMTSYRRNQPEGYRVFFRKGDAVDYWDGEKPPA